MRCVGGIRVVSEINQVRVGAEGREAGVHSFRGVGVG